MPTAVGQIRKVRRRRVGQVGQALLWPERSRVESRIAGRTGTFADNLKRPVHRWFKYSAGFSAEWVSAVLRERGVSAVFDPFVGSGTALLAAAAVGLSATGAEAHPFVARIAKAKTQWDFDVTRLRGAATELLERARRVAVGTQSPRWDEDSLITRIYAPEVLARLNALRTSYESLKPHWPSEIAELVRLAITSILRSCSHVGTAQWQYVLPRHQKSATKVREPWSAFEAVIEQFVTDREQVASEEWRAGASRVVAHDARQPFDFLGGHKFEAVITSPPYPNNYDYADATRLEMSFWGEIEGWGDLQKVVRCHLMRSCSQHTAAERLTLETLLCDPLLLPIRAELAVACERLARIRETRGGRKTYHTMAAAYFSDLARVFVNLREVTTHGASVCFVIGDSAPYGVHLPAERWLGELALAAGFQSWNFEKLRDRNVKWENRVHDVPLHEGNLWIEG